MLKYIYLICGKSGSGKSTLVDSLEKDYGYKVLRSYTTREKRHQDDIDHIYTDISTYDEQNKNGNIIAYTNFAGNSYWATKDQFNASDLYVIDKKGIISLLNKDNELGKHFISILIDVDEPELLHRMQARGDSKKAIADRTVNDVAEFKDIEDYVDFAVNGNRPFEQVKKTVGEIINACERIDGIWD